MVASQNNLEESDFIVKFPLKSRDNSTQHWVLEVEPAVFKKLMRERRLYLKWSIINFKEYLRETRCFNCNRYGHISQNCPNPKTCTNRGNIGHETGDCTNSAECVNCKISNEKFKRNYDVKHKCNDKLCPTLIKELEFLTSRIQYE